MLQTKRDRVIYEARITCETLSLSQTFRAKRRPVFCKREIPILNGSLAARLPADSSSTRSQASFLNLSVHKHLKKAKTQPKPPHTRIHSGNTATKKSFNRNLKVR